MNEQDINNLIKKGIDDYMNEKQYEVSKIPAHTHNGVDTVRIDAVNINQNVKYNTFIVSDTSETFVITNVFPNIGKVIFQGFAANNKSAPATKRAIVNGEAQFGNCFQFSGSGSNIALNGITIPIPIICSTNSFYVDTTDLTKTRVAAANEGSLIAYIVDDSATEIVTLEVVSYANNAITFTTTLAVDWKLQGTLTFI